jgi:hypothetical protein
MRIFTALIFIGAMLSCPAVSIAANDSGSSSSNVAYVVDVGKGQNYFHVQKFDMNGKYTTYLQSPVVVGAHWCARCRSLVEELSQTLILGQTKKEIFGWWARNWRNTAVMASC